MANLSLSHPEVSDGSLFLTIFVAIANTGSVAGSEVVQVYVLLPTTSELLHPGFQLKGFAKVHDLAPGVTETVSITLDKYAVSYWSELYHTAVVEKGLGPGYRAQALGQNTSIHHREHTVVHRIFILLVLLTLLCLSSHLSTVAARSASNKLEFKAAFEASKGFKWRGCK